MINKRVDFIESFWQLRNLFIHICQTLVQKAFGIRDVTGFCKKLSIIHLTLFIISPLLVSCFKEDDPISPYVPPEGLKYVELENSIYENQIFFDFSSETIKKVSNNADWQLGFECTREGYHIIINSSDFWGVVNTKTTNFQKTDFDMANEIWLFDSSSGNLDSTAIGEWVDVSSQIFTYTNDVYILGQYDGIRYTPHKKIQFLALTDTTYFFVYSNLDNSEADSVLIKKNNNFNFVHYSFDTKEQIAVEPPKESWDIVFGQYQTILFTDDGIPTPYFVRGTLLNPYKTTAALDTLMDFFQISKEDIYQFKLTKQKDFIGHDWKAVEVDQESNTAKYTVREDYNYFVVDNQENYFKFQFVSFTNTEGERGFPSFQYYYLE